MKPMRSALAACCAFGLLLGACGGDDDGGSASAESNEYSDAIAESIQSEEDTPFSDGEAECLAKEMVAAVGGPSFFEDAGISADDLLDSSDLSDAGVELSDDQIDDVAGVFGACDISLADKLLDTLGTDATDEQKDCAADALDEDVIADLFAQSLAGDDEEPDMSALGPLLACFS